MVYLYHPPEHTLHLPGGPTIPFRVEAVLSKHAYGNAFVSFLGIAIILTFQWIG